MLRDTVMRKECWTLNQTETLVWIGIRLKTARWTTQLINSLPVAVTSCLMSVLISGLWVGFVFVVFCFVLRNAAVVFLSEYLAFYSIYMVISVIQFMSNWFSYLANEGWQEWQLSDKFLWPPTSLWFFPVMANWKQNSMRSHHQPLFLSPIVFYINCMFPDVLLSCRWVSTSVSAAKAAAVMAAHCWHQSQCLALMPSGRAFSSWG